MSFFKTVVSRCRCICSFIESHHRKFLAGLILLGVALRLTAIYRFPFFVSEDTGPYLRASEFLRTGDPFYHYDLSFRQIGYPYFLLFFRENFHLPMLSVVLLQTVFSALAMGATYFVARSLKLTKIFSLAAVGFFVLRGNLILYNMSVAPEILIACLILFSAVVLIKHVEALQTGQSVFLSFALFSVQVLFALTMIALKEVFLSIAALLILTYSIALILLHFQKQKMVGHFISFLVALLMGYGGLQIYYSQTREELHSNEKHPICFPWTAPFLCYFPTVNRELPSDLNRWIHGFQLRQQFLIELPSYHFHDGYHKFNDCFVPWLNILDYKSKQQPDAKLNDLACETNRMTFAMVKENLGRGSLRYLRYYILPEIYRALYIDHHSRIGSSRVSFTQRDAVQYPQYNEDYQRSPWMREKVLRSSDSFEKEWTYWDRFSFNKHWALSPLFCFGVFHGFMSLLQRRRELVAGLGEFYLLGISVGLILIYAVLAWHFERYSTYFIIPFALIALRGAQDLLDRLVSVFRFLSTKII